MSKVFSVSNSEFYKTYNVYREYVGYKSELTYRQWMRLDDKYKAAVLYCQFFDEITLAWYKVNTEWSNQCDGVSIINQYLIKNVDKIKEDRKKFDPRYIYKVAYNCLYCLCIDPSKNKERFETETSETFSNGDDECSWFDIVGSDKEIEDISYEGLLSRLFNKVNEGTQIFIQYTLNEINERQAFLAWKKLGICNGSSSNKELVSTTVNNIEVNYKLALRKLIANGIVLQQ